MGRAKKGRRPERRSGSRTAASATGAIHIGSSNQSAPSQQAQAQAQAQAQDLEDPPSAKLGDLRLVDDLPQPARQANTATTNQILDRVGPRELGAILKPHLLDRSSSASPLTFVQAEVEEEAEVSRTSPAYEGNRNCSSSHSTPSSGKRFPKGNVLDDYNPSRKADRRQLRGKSTTPRQHHNHRHHPEQHYPNWNSTPRGRRARNRELARELQAVGGEGEHLTRNSNSHKNGIMASQQSKWREEMVLVICPGSQTTMAQLGCNELTPPTHRFPTRVFRDPSNGGYRPYHTYRRKKASANTTTTTTTGNNGKAPAAAGAKPAPNDDEYEDVEDPDNVEGAIYPLQGGRIVNIQAFLAFLDHVHTTLAKTNHNTPIVLMASPQWTRGDCENIARYIFEKTKTPALSLLHSGIASQYGLKHQTMTVVDIGFEKVDVTCIHENLVVGQKSLGFPSPVRDISGGEVFTQKLLSLLKNKGFTYDMAEQLKKSSLCEVLPYAPDAPEFMELPTDTDASHHIAEQPISATTGTAAVGAIVDDTEDGGDVAKEGEDGVLDVANIVTSGNTREFLAKKEKEKAEKSKSKKGSKAQEAESAAAKAIRLPNSKKKFTIFHYEDLTHEDVQVPVPVSNGTAKAAAGDSIPAPNPNPANGETPVAGAPAPAEAAAAAAAAPSTTATGEVKPEESKPNVDQTPPAPTPAPAPAPAPAAAAEPTPTSFTTERRTKRIRKDVEIGLERFLFASRPEIDRVVSAIYTAIQSIDEPYKRPACWDSLVFVGNGSRLRGFRDNILQTLHARHLVSPSSATIFTSELPSNMATPSGTGSQTPTGSYAGVQGQVALPTASSVNPLLQAATTASSLGVPGQVSQQQGPGSDTVMGGVGGNYSHHNAHAHGQTPTSIKLATLPTYLADWTKNGFEEAMFLGALVFGRLVFCHNVDAEAQRMLSLSRVEYNELGPKGIRTHSCMP